MISNQTLFLTEDHEKAVPEGDPKAKFLLVRAGSELPDAQAEKYGITAEKKKSEAPAFPPAEPNGSPVPQNREDAMPKRRTRGRK